MSNPWNQIKQRNSHRPQHLLTCELACWAEAEIERLQAESDSWEETVNAMLCTLSVKRRGTPHGPVEAVQNTVSSYEGEVKGLQEERAMLRERLRVICRWTDLSDGTNPVQAVCEIEGICDEVFTAEA